MKDEIKDLLQYLKNVYESEETSTWLNKLQIKDLLDYITNLQEENERLKNGYCELKVKCNNGECDCTNEEYEGMVQANIRGSLLLEDYKTRNEKAIEYIEYQISQLDFEKDTKAKMLGSMVLVLLQGSDE